MTELTTKLRPLEPEDLDELYAIENDREVWNVGATNVPYSRYALHEYIARQQADIYADRQLRLVVENAEKQVVGLVDLVNFEPQHRRVELGIVIKQAFRGQGYGQSALKKMLEYAKKSLHLHQIYVIIDAENHESLQLFRQVGFEEKSRLTDWLFDGEKYREAVFLQKIL